MHFIHQKCIFKQIYYIFAPAKQLRYNEFNKKIPFTTDFLFTDNYTDMHVSCNNQHIRK